MKRREMNNRFIFFYNSFDVLSHVTRGPTTLGPAEEDKDCSKYCQTHRKMAWVMHLTCMSNALSPMLT